MVEKLEKPGQEVIYSSKGFNYKYMEFFGYETCDKLIWTSGEGIININKISRQGIPNTHINKVHHSSTLVFGCYPHKDDCSFL